MEGAFVAVAVDNLTLPSITILLLVMLSSSALDLRVLIPDLIDGCSDILSSSPSFVTLVDVVAGGGGSSNSDSAGRGG
jgi:hypothetical protein